MKEAKGDGFIQDYYDVMAMYGSDFDENRFQVQLKTLQEYCTNLDGIRFLTETLPNLKVLSHLSEVLNSRNLFYYYQKQMPRPRENLV